MEDLLESTRADREFFGVDRSPSMCNTIVKVHRRFESECAEHHRRNRNCQPYRGLFLYCEAKRKARMEARENFRKVAAAVNFATTSEYLMHLF
ncbi:hypothetical protein LguiA_026493 [Lonicera macranthoides]